MRKKQMIEQIHEYEREVSLLKTNIREAESKIRKYEQGLCGECVKGTYCESCSHGLEYAKFYGIGGKAVEWAYGCDLAVPCVSFDRKDRHEQ